MAHPASPDIVVRRATVDDAERIAQVHVRGWQAAFGDVLSREWLQSLAWQDRVPRWRESVTADVLHTFVAVCEGEIVGFISFELTPEPEGVTDSAGIDGLTEIRTLYVDPDWWRRGIGRRLLEEGLAATGRADSLVFLWTAEQTGQSRSFYEKAGFHADGAPQDLVYDGQVMRAVRYRRAAASSPAEGGLRRRADP